MRRLSSCTSGIPTIRSQKLKLRLQMKKVRVTPNNNWEPERANQNCWESPGTKKRTKFKWASQFQPLSRQKGVSWEKSQKSMIHSVWLHPWPSLEKCSTEMLATRRSREIAPYQVTYKPNGRNGSWFCRARQVPYQSQNRKAYLAFYSCSLIRSLFLEVLPKMATNEFLRSLKRLIARRGRPEKIYSDNGKTFVGAEKWLKQVMRDEKTQDYLAHENIKWQFNLSRAAWWGGQFERLIGLVKTALNKTIGCGMLTWTELCEVVLDVEIALNNRPLRYVEDDI